MVVVVVEGPQQDKITENLSRNILIKAGATDERDAAVVMCVFGFSFLSDTFSLEWPWQQSRLICSTLTPLYLLLLLDISSLRKERKWSDATPALWYLFRDKYSPRPSALLFASGKPSLWCEASLILISLDTLCLLLAATASADLPNYCQANSGIEAGRGGGERGGNK